MTFRTIGEAGKALRTRRVSCLELVEESLRTIEERDGDLNAFITVMAEEARQQARLLDTELQLGRDRGPLHGIPIALKDLFYTKGVRTTNGSKIFEDFIPSYDATVVVKLRDAGAVCMGKLNMHEMAYGITSNNPHFGPVRNPHNRNHIPGGSSGGSGAAVATGMVFMAMGSDTGGSIRIPAAYCGTVGLKPTFGRVSRHGVFPLGLTLDHMGPLTRTSEDAAITLAAIAGYDSQDDATVRRSLGAVSFDGAPVLPGTRIGVAKNFFNDAVDREVSLAIDRALRGAEDAGALLVELDFPDPAALNIIARAVLLCEASAVLQPHLHRRKDFGSDVLALLDQGREMSGTDYVNAQRVRKAMQVKWAALFQQADVLLLPTAPIAAPQIGQASVTIGGKEEDARLATTRFVRGINALGLPAIAVPAGTTTVGMPVSLQLVGKAWDEPGLLRIASAMEAILPVVHG